MSARVISIGELPAAIGVSYRESRWPYLIWRPGCLKDFDRECTHEVRGNLIKMTREIARLCDGAKMLDGVGFDKGDAHDGHLMVKMLHFTDSHQTRAWCRVLYKYRHQLGCTTDESFYKMIFEG